jgi:hypothetical protein
VCECACLMRCRRCFVHPVAQRGLRGRNSHPTTGRRHPGRGGPDRAKLKKHVRCEASEREMRNRQRKILCRSVAGWQSGSSSCLSSYTLSNLHNASPDCSTKSPRHCSQSLWPVAARSRLKKLGDGHSAVTSLSRDRSGAVKRAQFPPKESEEGLFSSSEQSDLTLPTNTDCRIHHRPSPTQQDNIMALCMSGTHIR